MKKIRSAIFSCALYCCALSFLQAQSVITTIIAPTATVQPSTIYKADIKVVHFKKIVGMQFTMKWDAAILRFREVKGFVLSANPQTESFGKTKITTGMLAFQWFDESLVGRTLDDSTTLFSIEFDVIGTSNAFTKMIFTDDIALREIADASLDAIPAEYHTGTINIASTTGVHAYNSAPHLVKVEDSFPNPFHDYTQIQLNLQASAQARLIIQNVQGQTVYEEQRFFSSGENTLRLTKEMFPVAGTYHYTILASDFIITQKLIFF
jgi:hypothetical protein